MPTSDLSPYITDWIDIKVHPFRNSLKFETILRNFTHYRSTERDGNCFYSSFLSQLLEHVKFINKNEYTAFCDILEGSNKIYEQMEGDRTVYKEFYNTFIARCQECRGSDLVVDRVSKMDLLGMITYLKILIRVELMSKKDHYHPFLVETSIDEYCQKRIDPLFKDTEHLEIQALANLLKTNIKVLSVTEYTVETNDFGDFDSTLTILHTINHFEPIRQAL